MKKTDRLAVNGFLCGWIAYTLSNDFQVENLFNELVYSEFRSRGHHLELAHGTQ